MTLLEALVQSVWGNDRRREDQQRGPRREWPALLSDKKEVKWGITENTSELNFETVFARCFDVLPGFPLQAGRLLPAAGNSARIPAAHLLWSHFSSSEAHIQWLVDVGLKRPSTLTPPWENQRSVPSLGSFQLAGWWAKAFVKKHPRCIPFSAWSCILPCPLQPHSLTNLPHAHGPPSTSLPLGNPTCQKVVPQSRCRLIQSPEYLFTTESNLTHGRTELGLQGFFCKGKNPYQEGSVLRTSSSPQSLSTWHHHLGR